MLTFMLLQSMLSTRTFQLRKRSTTLVRESCTTPTLTWHICTRKMRQSYRSTIQEEICNVSQSDLLGTSLDTDPLISMKNWKLRTLSESVQVIGDQSPKRKPRGLHPLLVRSPTRWHHPFHQHQADWWKHSERGWCLLQEFQALWSWRSCSTWRQCINP